MKLGAENRTKLFAAIGLMLLAIVVLLFSFGGSTPTPTSPAASAVAPVTTARTTTPARPSAHTKSHGKKAVITGPRSLDPTLRYDLLKASEDTKYEGNGRNIFQLQAEIPKPVDTGVAEKTDEEKGPPPPPPPPPINLKFFGFASKPGEAKKIFLSEGEDIFVAAEGEVVNRHYKVLRISPTSVEIEDVLNNNRQSIPLTLG